MKAVIEWGMWMAWSLFQPLISQLLHKSVRVNARMIFTDPDDGVKKEILIRNGFSNQVWTYPGGGVEKGETLEEALVREIYEELRLRISTDQLSDKRFSRKYISRYHYVERTTFTVELIDEPEIKIRWPEIIEWKKRPVDAE